MGHARIDLHRLEQEINASLAERCSALLSDPGKKEIYSHLFDRTSEEGFYSSTTGPKAEGEQPTWEPNPAYMTSLEELWKDSDDILERSGLRIEPSLRQGFYLSREYKDMEMIHRRVFTGQLIDVNSGKAITCYMLTVPHSHDQFDYAAPPVLYVSKSL